MRLPHRTLIAALTCTAACLAAPADGLDAIQHVLGNQQTSPVPRGLTLGGAVYNGSSVYSAAGASTMLIPGAIYIGDDWVYLGDRAFYTFARQGPVSFFGRLRVRLGNLDPADHAEWAGMTERKAQLEAGLGAVVVSPVGLWTARFSSDISGRSKGSDVLLNWSAPIVGDRWLLMPGAGVFWRSQRLANYYYGGVSAAEAAPGRPAYDVGDAWSFVPSLIASYRIDANWLAGAVLSYDRFSDSVADSPLVQKKGRYDVLLGLGYVWR